MKRRWGRRGATQVMVAVALPALIGLAALAVDIGHLVVEKQHLQQLCDTAAIAGGADLPTSLAGQEGSQAVQTATEYANANGATRAGVSFSAASVPPSQPGASWQLQVSATEDVPMAFARIWGCYSRQLYVQATAEREPAPGWVPVALVRKGRWLNLPPGDTEVIPLSECAVGQWWVTAAHGAAIDFTTAFQQGANVGLQVGDPIQLAATGSGSAATPAAGSPLPTKQQVLSGLQQRVGQTVQVLMLNDDVMSVDRTRPVTDEDKVGSATFSQFATIQITKVDPGSDVFEIKFVSEGTGDLNAGMGSTHGQVRLIR